MDGANEFRDQPQVEQIRDRLWSGREFGQAAVMIGAGFSRNAESRSPGAPPYPSWAQLGEAMYDVLYPVGAGGVVVRKDEKRRASSGSGAMRLASEYETVFGRSALDDFLARAIPDEWYEPGRLHEMLLSLPWSDVFTTNYDTLLERTRPAVYERKYDLVLTASDLPSRAKPRIVKLHGSFPSHRPFVITEDDYRTYPTRFAPFVNTVQQSIMENAFCLLGFSGEDPNFLSWIGWVRDNLGASTPPIYLCGLLNLSNSQRRLLESRNVVPVDLSPLFPTVEWHDPAQRHANALEWFLLNLVEGEPPKVDRWPVPSKTRVWDPSEGLPEVPAGPRPIPDSGAPRPVPMQSTIEDVQAIYAAWRGTRLSYPGWTIAPEKNRTRLWEHTEYWIEPVLGSVGQVAPPEDLFLLHELNWRLERCLVPLFTNWHEAIARVLNNYNPFPGQMHVDGATIRPDEAGYRDFDWNRVASCWVELAFALVRRAREDQDEGEFRLWMDLLEDVVRGRREWQARWSCEESAFHLARLDQEGARAALEGWPAASGLPIWEIRRASVLAELGELEAAERVAGAALNDIRSRLQPYSSDYALLSQEGLALYLLEGIRANDLYSTEDAVPRHRDRLEALEGYGCNPWTEVRGFEGTVVGLPPPLRGFTEKTTLGFDPGRENTTINFPSGFTVGPILPAFALQKIVEEGPLLPKIGNVNMFSSTVPAAARWIEPYSPLWAFSSFVRYANPKSIYARFNRVYVATLPAATVDHLFGVLSNSLVQSMHRLVANTQEADLQSGGYSQRLAKVSSELLSRLSMRCSEQQREVLFDLAVQMYGLPLFRERHWMHDCVKTLFRRLLPPDSGAPRSQILRRVPELLSLPIPSEAGFQVSTPEMWVEPFDHIGGDYDEELGADFDSSSWSAPIANLLRIVRDGVPEARKRAARRLDWLHTAGALSDEETDAFGEALWSRLDLSTDLPSDTAYYAFAFLRLPEPEPGRAKRSFRQRMRSMDFVRAVIPGSADGSGATTTFSPGHADEPYTRELLYSTATPFTRDEEERRRFVDWNLEEATHFLRKMVQRWDEEKEVLRPLLSGGQDNFFATTMLQRFEGWLRVVSEVVLPRLPDAPDETKVTARRLVTELEQVGCHASSALPALLYVDPELSEEIARKLRAGLASGEEREVRAAAHGLFLWLAHSADGRIVSSPVDLLDRLITRALSRRQAALGSVLNCLRDVARMLPGALNDRQLDDVCLTLEHLLEDTELPEHGGMEQEDRIAGLIAVERRPEYRRLAAQLAYRLSEEFGRKEKETPDILERWRRACMEDSLPEVRNAWG